MRQWPATLLAMLALATANHVIAASSFCYDERLSISDAQRKGCQSREVKLREDSTIVPVQLARVIVGTRQQGPGNLTALWHYLLLRPNGQISVIGEFLSWEDPMANYWWSTDLGFNVARRAEVRHLTGYGPVTYSRVYETVIEKNDDRYCLLRLFKHPFEGETRACPGDKRPEGRVGYTKGTIRVDEAWKSACAHVVTATTQSCGELRTSLQRDETNSLNYNVVLGHGDGSYVVFRVSANTGDVTFLEQGQNMSELGNRYWD